MFEEISNYFKGIFATLFSVGGAMFMGLKTMVRPNVTTQYPRERWDVPDGSRMKLYNNIDDCIGCYKCSRICPTDCIEIDTVKAPNDVDLGKASTGNPLNFWVTKFDIDMVKCCYCDLCTTVCPTECLVMTKAYEGSAYDRGNLIYHFSNIDSEKMEEINEILEEDEKEEEEAASAASGGTATATAGGTKTVTKIVSEKPEDELTTRERIELRLVRNEKLDAGDTDLALKEVEEEVTVESQPAETTTATVPSPEESQEEPAGATEEPEESAPDEDKSSEEDSDSDDSGGGDTSGYVRDESKPVMERIRARLEARGKL